MTLQKWLDELDAQFREWNKNGRKSEKNESNADNGDRIRRGREFGIEKTRKQIEILRKIINGDIDEVDFKEWYDLAYMFVMEERWALKAEKTDCKTAQDEWKKVIGTRQGIAYFMLDNLFETILDEREMYRQLREYRKAKNELRERYGMEKKEIPDKDEYDDWEDDW